MSDSYWRQQSRMLLRLVGIPIACVTAAAFVFLGLFGGVDLLRFAFRQLLTWNGVKSTVFAIGGLIVLTWLRHIAWYEDELPPMWFRRSVWTNLIEFAILVALIALIVWGILHFGHGPAR